MREDVVAEFSGFDIADEVEETDLVVDDEEGSVVFIKAVVGEGGSWRVRVRMGRATVRGGPPAMAAELERSITRELRWNFIVNDVEIRSCSVSCESGPEVVFDCSG